MGGGIVEVNAAPGFRMHTHPTEGEAQYVAKPVIDMLFPPGTPSRIPIVAITGSNGKTTTARMVTHILKGMGRKVGLTSTDGIFVDGRVIRRGDMSGPRSASTVLQNPMVDFAVFEVARGSGLTLIELAPGVDVEEIQAKTEAAFSVSAGLKAVAV